MFPTRILVWILPLLAALGCTNACSCFHYVSQDANSGVVVSVNSSPGSPRSCSCRHRVHRANRKAGRLEGLSDGSLAGEQAGYTRGLEWVESSDASEVPPTIELTDAVTPSDLSTLNAKDPHYVDAYLEAFDEAYRRAHADSFDRGYLDRDPSRTDR
ncbi:MAG: hypothetical protein AAF517_25645 [Planctomycetota bacterium]